MQLYTNLLHSTHGTNTNMQLHTNLRHNTRGTNTNIQLYTNLLHNTHGTNKNMQLYTNILHNTHCTNTNMQLHTNLRHNTRGTKTNVQLYMNLRHNIRGTHTHICNSTWTFDTTFAARIHTHTHTHTHMKLYTNLRHNTHGPNTHIHLIHEPSTQLTAAGCLHYETTILWRVVPFSMKVLLRERWQWGGTPIGLSVKLTHLGHPHNHQDFHYKTGHYWLQRNGILARFDCLDCLPFRAPRPFETSGITHTHNATESHFTGPQSFWRSLIASHLVKKFLALRNWAFVSAFTKTGPLDCLQANMHTLFL